MLRITFLRVIREIQFNTPLRRYFFPRYAYNFTVPQLCFLCKCIEDTQHVKGSIAEVGCAKGETTLFLNKYMDAQNIRKTYYAIDTFSGFTAGDIEFEVAKRRKTRGLFTGFKVNKKKWFDSTMRQNNINRVKSIEADVTKYDLAQLEPLSFCLLDVDLYRPMKKCLKELYEILSPGGIVVVDDCNAEYMRREYKWDGSDQAYREFMKEIDQPVKVIYGKLGVLKKA